MRLLLLLISISFIASCACINAKTSKNDIGEQRKIYKSWVVSRCIASIATTEAEKQDALNSASAYLEVSRFSIDSLSNAKPLINEFLTKNYQGSIPGTFNTKKCVDLLYSDELEKIFLAEYKSIK